MYSEPRWTHHGQAMKSTGQGPHRITTAAVAGHRWTASTDVLWHSGHITPPRPLPGLAKNVYNFHVLQTGTFDEWSHKETEQGVSKTKLPDIDYPKPPGRDPEYLTDHHQSAITRSDGPHAQCGQSAEAPAIVASTLSGCQTTRPRDPAREAEMATEELEAAVRPNSPPPRSTPLTAHITVGRWFEYGDFLDSQMGDGTYVTISAILARKVSKQARVKLVEEDEPMDESFELEDQIKRLQSRVKFVLKEKDDLEWQRDNYRYAYQETDAGRNQALKKLRQWQEAAVGASPLLNWP
ncbi:hypothetical protein DFH07DRAFT_782456 [Mycena maculata]|uniref:Uncharacterized protein n=1 Tax=Mycena maculata TaxID=230809 RepID=A0AAD7MQJ1_9AGAR|nr:hypothetical protein DFH07DRAFT_782456 [Mycena maculata]